MKFIFFYSKLYEYYKNHINEALYNIFNVESIVIDDMKKNDNSWHTFCNGVSIKIELIIDKIKENYNDFIIFTDATIFINKNNTHLLNNFFKNYEKFDITFADNTGFGDPYNIGVILIKCNKETLNFFETVLYDLNKNKGWDQHVVNNHIKNTELKIGCFDNTKIHCGDNFNSKLKDSFYIYKSFIPHTNDPITNFNARIYKFYNSNLIDECEFKRIIKEK